MFRSRLPATREGWVVAGYLAVALVFGGGGSPSAAAEIIVQLAFAGAVLAWIVWADRPLPVPRGPVRWLAVLPIALALSQLVPLPPPVWQALPGRALEVRSLGLVGAEAGWMPLSLAPGQSLAALLAIIPPVGAMLATVQLGRRDRQALLLLITVVGLAAGVLGAAQIGAQGDQLRLYQQANRPWITGFFANRNSAADFFLVSALALATWSAVRANDPRRPAAGRRVGEFAGLAVLATALVLTGSRAGIALALPVAVMVAKLRPGSAISPRRIAAACGLAVAVVGAGAVAVLTLPRLSGVAQRFATAEDFRFSLWQDAWAAAVRYFPLGSGLGTFTTAYLPVETLELVDQTFPSRAHNEPLELLIEAGLPGIAIAVIMAALVLRLWRRAQQDERVLGPHRLFAGGTLLVMALHSLVDYPLRSMALASLAGVATGFLVRREAKGRVMSEAEQAV